MFGSAKPKKVYVAAKPPNAQPSEGRVVRVDLARLTRVPGGRRGAACAGLLLLALALAILPHHVSLVNTRSLLSHARARVALFRLDSSSEFPALYRNSPRSSVRAMDPRASLYGALVAGEGAPMADEARHAATRLLGEASGLASTSGWAQVLCALGSCPERCSELIRAFLVPASNNSKEEGLFREAASFPPTLRAQLDGLSALRACGALPAPLASSAARWARSLMHAGGGYPAQAGMPASVMATWRAAQLLKMAGETDSDDADADTAQWLGQCAGLDGGFHDRPSALLERGARLGPSPTLPALRAAHALLLLGHPLPSRALRFTLGHLLRGSAGPAALHAALSVVESLPAHQSSPSLAISHPALAGMASSLALAAAAAAACCWIGGWPASRVVWLSGLLLGAGVAHEAGLAVVSGAATVLALALGALHIARTIPFNDTGEEMLYISLGAAAATAGLLYALGMAAPDVYLTPAPFLVCSFWLPFASAFCVYLAAMLLSHRPLSFYTGAVFAGWVIAIAAVVFVLNRRDMLEPLVPLFIARGHFTSVLVAVPLCSLWLSLGLTHVALSL